MCSENHCWCRIQTWTYSAIILWVFFPFVQLLWKFSDWKSELGLKYALPASLKLLLEPRCSPTSIQWFILEVRTEMHVGSMQDFYRFFCPISEKIWMCRQVLVKLLLSNFVKICSAELELLHAKKIAQQTRIFSIFPNGRAKNGKLSFRNKILQSPPTQNVYF